MSLLAVYTTRLILDRRKTMHSGWMVALVVSRYQVRPTMSAHLIVALKL
jgi:hypothetical protein